MKKIRSLLIICFSFLLFSSIPRAVALNYPISVNYGKIQPEKETALNQILPFSLNTAQADGILVETSGLTGANSRQILPSNRMKLSVGDQSYSIANSSLKIVFEEHQKTKTTLNFTLSLELLPSDLPDNYSGLLIIRPWLDTPQGRKWNNTITAQLTVAVQPWIKLLCDQTAITLETTHYSNRSIQNEQPLRIKVASNTDWLLYCCLKSSVTELIPVINVSDPASAGVQTFNPLTGFSNNRKNLAVGRMTTANDKYWCDLLLTLEIKNVINYPTGKYQIPLQFGVEFWNNPSD